MYVDAGSAGGVADVRQKTRRDGKEEQNEHEESHEIPSFQNAFNEALFSASVSVIAAQNGDLFAGVQVYCTCNQVFVFVQLQEESQVVGLLRRAGRNLCCSPLEA